MILCLAETTLDSWDARRQYLIAKSEQERLDIYGLDLLWLLAKRHYQNLPQPSDVAESKRMTDTRTAKQIQQDLAERLGGGTNGTV